MGKRRKIRATSSLKQRAALLLFGVLLAFIMLEAGLQISGFFVMAVQQCKNWVSMKKGASYRIMCVGESTTQGQYPRFLEEILNARQTQTRFSVIDEGLCATDTRVILGKMEERIKKYRPDAVVAMIGINDEGARHMPAGFSVSRRSFIQSLKTYRLVQLLRMHFKAKLADIKNELPGNPRSEASATAPRDDAFYVKLGMQLHAQNRTDEAQAAFREALKLNPGNTEAYFKLLWLRDHQEQAVMIRELVEKYKKEFMVCPEEGRYLPFLFVQLNAMYKYAEAETLLKILREHCHAGWIWHFSGETAAAQDRYEEAIAYYKEAIKLDRSENRSDFRPYLGLAYVYRAQGRSALSEEALAQGNAFAEKGYAGETVENYRKIKRMLDERGIRLICVQYPMRDLEPLKRIFPRAHGQNLCFVDNQELFKKALKKYRFEELFRDRFAGDFGHCTDLGNTILAGNIARVILRDLFGISVAEEALNH